MSRSDARATYPYSKQRSENGKKSKNAISQNIFKSLHTFKVVLSQWDSYLHLTLFDLFSAEMKRKLVTSYSSVISEKNNQALVNKSKQRLFSTISAAAFLQPKCLTQQPSHFWELSKDSRQFILKKKIKIWGNEIWFEEHKMRKALPEGLEEKKSHQKP